MLTLCLVVAISVAGALRPAVQDPAAPPTPSVIPIYPGAERYDPPEYLVARPVGETLFALPALPDSWLLRRESNAIYLVGATADQVADYYRKTLKGTPSSFDAWKAVDPRTLSPGRSTPIHYQRYTAAGTTQYLYHWYRREQDGNIVLYELGFADSFDPRDPPRTK